MTEARNKGGRPPFRPTQAQRDDVELMRVAGMNQAAIAKTLGIDEDTMLKYFRVELDSGVARKHREVLKMLHAAARKGNVSAQKKLLEVAERRIAANQMEAWSKEKPIPVRLQPGKKEQAAMEAKTAGDGTEWGDDLKFAGRQSGELPN